MGIYHERIVSHARYQEGQTSYYVELTVDKAADIPDPAEHPEWEVGSELIVLENSGSKYRLSNAREWVSVNFNDSQEGGDMSAYALKSEVNTEAQNRIAADTALQESITALDAKIEQKFITLVSGDDLNTITAQNRYRSPSGTVTKAIANVPEVVGNNGFSLEVYTTASYPFYVQEITWCGYSTFLVNKIVRCGRTVDGALQWGEWYQYGLAMVGEAT